VETKSGIAKQTPLQDVFPKLSFW